MTHPTLSVLERHLKLYRRLWRASVFSFFVLPALFMVSIGFGVGAFVQDIDGVPYSAWIAPALLAVTVFQISVNESTFGVYTDFEWIGIFHVMRNTRVRMHDMITGWLLYVLVVVEISIVAFLTVMAVFGVWQPVLWLVAPFIGALLAVSVATPTTAFSATIRDDGDFQLLNQFGVIPLTLVSGVYFPVDQLPGVLLPLTYLSPLWHSVELLRDAVLGRGDIIAYSVHIGYLALWAALGYLWARKAFRRRLAG
jgi:lipooligosaccharide transport system permease protein